MYRDGLRRLVSLLAVGCCMAAWASPAGAHPTPTTGFGINAWYLFSAMPESSWDGNLAAMAADDITSVRADAQWSAAEPTAPGAASPQYNWTTFDAIASALARHGLRWLPIIDYTAPWNESVAGDMNSAPSNVGDYVQYAAAFVARYGPGGSFWHANPGLTPEPVTAVEIWNEEDVTGTYIAPATYAPMYEQARTAIHGVDPSVTVVVGGLAEAAESYMQQLQQAIGKPGQIDAVAQHPYDQNPAAVLNDVASMRSTLDGLGDGKVPIYVTEYGWPLYGVGAGVPTLSDSQRGTYLYQTITGLADSSDDVLGIYPYSWVSQAANIFDPEQWYGITSDGAATASSTQLASAYQHVAAEDVADGPTLASAPVLQPVTKPRAPAAARRRRRVS